MATKPKKKNPRLASGRKRARQDVKLNAANTSLRSKYRTAVKNVEKAVLAGDKTKAAELFGKMQAVVDTFMTMARLPLSANILFTTVMATKMPFVGRG